MKNYDDYEMLNVKKELANIFLNKGLRFERSFKEYDYTNDEIKQSADNLVTDFMIEKWDSDWEENEQASFFYEATACDMRIVFEREMIELYNDINS